MLLSFMLTVSFILVDCKIHRRHVPNCVEPQQVEEVYNLNEWINNLHLQQCVFVAIGENFFAIFLEKIPRPFDDDHEVKDYFIGICDEENLRKWKLCPVPVQLKRPEDCLFEKDLQQSARVHRRLCELSELTNFASQCNCDSLFRGEKLVNVVGFPTCFRPQLVNSLCGYNNVCGLHSCKMSTVAGRIHTVKCDENCFGHKPFCESPEWHTSKPREITSFWSDWSDSECTNVECISMSSEARCINKETGMGDVDCLGPGTSLDNCKCHVFIEDGMLKVIRIHTVQPAPEYEEISLEELIKNLPLKHEHRQRQPNLKRRYKLTDRNARDINSDFCHGEDFAKDMRKYAIRMVEEDDDEDDEDYDIKSIEKDDDDKEDDIMIEEEDITTTTPKDDEDMESKNIKAIHAFREAHENDTIIDVPDRNISTDEGVGMILRSSTFLVAACGVILCVMNVNTIDVLY